MANTRYAVRIYDYGASFGVGTLVCEFELAKNIGYADYINDVPEAFFTISQEDPKVTLLRNHKGNKHVRIYRGTSLVWAGWLGEHEGSRDDVIFYAYGYMSDLAFLLTDWGTAYTNAQINTIVSDAWTRAKTTLTSSRLGWVTTGTIQAPVTTSGGVTAIVLPTYEMYYKNTLQLFKEMAALGIGDTTNVVRFEITPSGTFNFWKNYGDDKTFSWRYPDDVILDYRESYTPIMRANEVYAVGVNPNDDLLRTTKSRSADITANGRHTVPVFFSWVRDSTELSQAAANRLSRAARQDFDFSLTFKEEAIVPPYASGATWKIGDRIPIKLRNGITSVWSTQMVAGYQVLIVGGREKINVLMQERPGV